MLGVQPRDLIEGTTEKKKKDLTAEFEFLFKAFYTCSDRKSCNSSTLCEVSPYMNETIVTLWIYTCKE